MNESDAIKELRGNYKRCANELAKAILALCDAQGCKSFASRDEIRWSDCTVHLMVFVDPKRKGKRILDPKTMDRPAEHTITRLRKSGDGAEGEGK